MSSQVALSKVQGTAYGLKLKAEDELRSKGRGLPSRSAKLRLFDAADDYEPRVVFYRDSAAWCPYCQKVWMLLEEKKIPYRVELINMRSYGDKPQDFLRKVPGGFLPAIELDGQVVTESLDIMALLDRTFEGIALVPREESTLNEARELLRLERQLFRSWCDYVFRGGFGSKGAFERDLVKVDNAIEGPFFLGKNISIVDLQYVSHIERMSASVAYWKGDVLRGNPKYPKINQWFEALEKLPSYRASRSDFYTHIKDIPPQYGDGNFDKQRSKDHAHALTGGDWTMDSLLQQNKVVPLEVQLQPGWDDLYETANTEAAYRLLQNLEAIVKFASRPAGPKGIGKWAGGRPDRAKLADPYAEPAKESKTLGDIRSALVAVADNLLLNDDGQKQYLLSSGDVSDAKTTALCLAYLRDRVGVPRDMSFPAARSLRCHLNGAIAQLSLK